MKAQGIKRKYVNTVRVAPGLQPEKKNTVSRDPRFDASGSASFDDAGWRKSYDFVFERQREEAAEAKRVLKESDRAAKLRAKSRAGGAKKQRIERKRIDPEQAAELRYELDRNQSQLNADAKRAQEQAVKSAVRKTAVAAAGDGEQPFFLKKSAMKEHMLLAKFRELQKSGKLDEFMAKKRRKAAGKHKKHRSSE